MTHIVAECETTDVAASVKCIRRKISTAVRIENHRGQFAAISEG